MGSVHKFPRPPKNKQQFKGYQPNAKNGMRLGRSGRQHLRDWQKGVLAWSALLIGATGCWAISKVL